MKYLLTSGKTTEKLEYYVIDLFKLYLTCYPNDIPGSPKLGFNFSLSDTMKADLVNEVRSKVNSLVSLISGRFNSQSVEIGIEKLDIVDETSAKLVISVNKLQSDEILIDLYD